MKKFIIALVIGLMSITTLAWGPGPGGRGPGSLGHGFGPHGSGGWHHSGGPGWGGHPGGGWWGRGGRNFLPGFVGGIIGGAVANVVTYPSYSGYYSTPVVSQPVVVQQPVVTTPVIQQSTVVNYPTTVQTKFWVEGYWTNELKPSGRVQRRWIPGHWEYR